MLAVQPGRLGCTKEELRTVGIRPRVCHTKDSWPSMLELEVFVLELCAVDTFAPSSIVVREVSALAHEIWNDSVETTVFETKSLLVSAKLPEILGRLGHYVRSELHLNPTGRLAANLNVEINLWVLTARRRSRVRRTTAAHLG